MAQERLAKIVCTIGPASIAEGIIEQMARAGNRCVPHAVQLSSRRAPSLSMWTTPGTPSNVVQAMLSRSSRELTPASSPTNAAALRGLCSALRFVREV